jgi:hypothetical protein
MFKIKLHNPGCHWYDFFPNASDETSGFCFTLLLLQIQRAPYQTFLTKWKPLSLTD